MTSEIENIQSKISTGLLKYVETTLFSNDYSCNFYEEVLVDNIPVNITLKYFVETGVVRCILHNKNIQKKLFEMNDDEEDEYLYNLLTDPNYIILCDHIPMVDKCKHVLVHLNTLIKNIKFCNYTGKFLHQKNIHYSNIRKDLPLFFKDNQNIKFITSEENKCCICYEPTIVVSSCDHPICITCAINIKPDQDDDCLCPMCREILSFI